MLAASAPYSSGEGGRTSLKLLFVVTCAFPGGCPEGLLDRWPVKGVGFVLVTTPPFDKFFTPFMVGIIKSFYELPISHVHALDTALHSPPKFTPRSAQRQLPIPSRLMRD